MHSRTHFASVHIATRLHFNVKSLFTLDKIKTNYTILVVTYTSVCIDKRTDPKLGGYTVAAVIKHITMQKLHSGYKSIWNTSFELE